MIEIGQEVEGDARGVVIALYDTAKGQMANVRRGDIIATNVRVDGLYPKGTGPRPKPSTSGAALMMESLLTAFVTAGGTL